MQTGGAVSDVIVRRLEKSIARLHDDFERVEFWAAVLNAFAQPVPSYEPPENEFLLPAKRRAEGGSGRGNHRPSGSA